MKRGDLCPAEMPVLLIPVDAIDVPADRLRSLKPLQAEAIGSAIKADRQYDPISVAQLPGSERFTLVDGLHRLEGFRLHGMPQIEARIVPSDRLGRLRQEISSAWARADHDVFDRAAQIKALADIARDDDPLQCIATALRWDIATAEALDVSPRTVRNYVTISGRYSAAEIAALRANGLADDLVPLLRVAALPPEDFATVMAWVAEGAVASIAEALSLLAPEKAPAWEKSTTKMVKQVADWPSMYRKRLIDELLTRYDRHGNEKSAKDAAL